MSDLSEIANYEIIRRIGEGGYGTVYLAKLKNRAEYLALKIIASKGIERERKALEKYLNISDRNNMVELLLGFFIVLFGYFFQDEIYRTGAEANRDHTGVKA